MIKCAPPCLDSESFARDVDGEGSEEGGAACNPRAVSIFILFPIRLMVVTTLDVFSSDSGFVSDTVVKEEVASRVLIRANPKIS